MFYEIRYRSIFLLPVVTHGHEPSLYIIPLSHGAQRQEIIGHKLKIQINHMLLICIPHTPNNMHPRFCSCRLSWALMRLYRKFLVHMPITEEKETL